MTDDPAQPIEISERTFGHVVCGIDGSPESAEAARQAGLVARPGATMRLVAAVDPLDELWDAPPYQALATAARVQERAKSALERARAGIASTDAVELEVVESPPCDALLARVAADREHLLAVGAGRQDRLAGILLGAIVTELLHTSPCAVFLARKVEDGETFPRAVLVGLDGSDGSVAAFAAARAVAERLGAPLRPVVALGGKRPDLDAVQRILDGRRFATDDRAPADALASARGELLVVGSRGLHGLAALGSVSERVAHRSAGSVLVVRPA
jgi:nucleotide-binding universal stress UspA family protein